MALGQVTMRRDDGKRNTIQEKKQSTLLASNNRFGKCLASKVDSVDMEISEPSETLRLELGTP